MLAQTYNQLYSIAKGSIHETAECLAEFGGEFLGCEAEEGGQRHDGEEVDDEGASCGPLQETGDDSERYKDEKYVDVVAKEYYPAHIGNLHWPTHPFAVVVLELDELATAPFA